MTESINQAIEKIRSFGGAFRTGAALRQGIHPRTLYAMRDSGILEQLSRGSYRLAGQGPLSNPDLVTVASRVPQGVLCLISALSFHNLTTQIPHHVSIALGRSMRNPTIGFPPLKVYRYDEQCYQSGIEEHLIDGIAVNVYCPEKTLADCFKFRNKIGLDVAIEALKTLKSKRRVNINQLISYAKINRVEKIIKPYLESIL